MPLPADIDAVSLAPDLEGRPTPPEQPRDLYFVRREGGPAYGGLTYEALIRGPWKLLRNDPFSPYELYNLDDDPQERTDLAARLPHEVRGLKARLQAHVQRGGAVPWQPPAGDP